MKAKTEETQENFCIWGAPVLTEAPHSGLALLALPPPPGQHLHGFQGTQCENHSTVRSLNFSQGRDFSN